MPRSHPVRSRPRWRAQTQSLYRKYRPQTFDEEELVGQEHVVRTLRNAHRARSRRPRLPLLRSARHRQDDDGPTARQSGQLPRSRSGRKRPCNVCANCRAIATGAHDRRDRDRRRQQPRHRRHPRPARAGQVRADPAPHQVLHHRRGAPDHRRRGQRLSQDAGRAAGAHQVRARHDRSRRTAADDRLPLPAVRLSPHRRRGDGRPPAHCRRVRRSCRSTTTRCRRSLATPPAACATRSACSTNSPSTASEDADRHANDRP